MRPLFGKFSTRSKNVTLVLTTTLCISACDTLFPPTVNEICAENPELCEDLNPDAWCRAEKAEIIKHRFNNLTSTNDNHKYALMLMFEDYQKCIVKASGIQHIKYREKEAGRMKGVLTAERELARLSRETRHSPDPYLSFYHWSRHGDEVALARFMDYHTKNQLNTPELQLALATIQVKYNLDDTRDTLHRALSMYQDGDAVDTELFKSMITIHLDREKYNMAYVWALVADNYIKDSHYIENTKSLLADEELPFDVLEDVADEIISSINHGNFDAKKLGIATL